MVRRRANPGDVERLLLETAAQDGKRVRIGFGQDPGQAGKSQAQHLVRALSGFTVDPASETGDKLTRFKPFSSQCRAGNVKIRRGGTRSCSASSRASPISPMTTRSTPAPSRAPAVLRRPGRPRRACRLQKLTSPHCENANGWSMPSDLLADPLLSS